MVTSTIWKLDDIFSVRFRSAVTLGAYIETLIQNTFHECVQKKICILHSATLECHSQLEILQRTDFRFLFMIIKIGARVKVKGSGRSEIILKTFHIKQWSTFKSKFLPACR